MLRYAAAALFVLLVAAWLTVAVRTVRDGARGRLFLPAAPAPVPVPVPVPVPQAAPRPGTGPRKKI